MVANKSAGIVKWCLIALILISLSVFTNAESWPDKPISIVVASRVGGSLDGMARGLAKYLKPILGVPIVVVNKPGGVTSIATQELVEQPADGYTFLVTTTTPHLVATMISLDVDYELSDFTVLNNQWQSAEALHLHRQHDYADLSELLEDVKKNPGKLSVGVFLKSGGHLGLMLMLKEMDIPAKNLRIVYFDSGSQFRAALAGGHIDLAIMPLESVYAIGDLVTTMVVFADSRQAGFEEIVTVNEALEGAGMEIQAVPGFSRGLVARAEFKTEFPARYARFVAALQSIVENEQFKAEMAKRSIGREWIGPETSTKSVHDSYENFKKYNDMLSQFE